MQRFTEDGMARRERIVIGLNSGTSADGVDAAAVAISGRGETMKVRCLGHVARAYPKELRRRILAIMAPAATRTEELAALDVEIGRAFAETAAKLIKTLDLRRVDFIGSHGQTICHLPPGRAGAKNGAVNATLQIGDPATMAARLNTPVVSHFRQADMAVGGQGAPLVPWTDWVLLRHPKRTRIIQNIGGIANLTYLPAGGKPEDVIAFDTGPGNMLIDALVTHFSKGTQTFDKDGRAAARGFAKHDPKLVWKMLSHPFLKRMWPKSCGREEFGVNFMRALLKRHARSTMDGDAWIATATWFTAWAIAAAQTAVHVSVADSLYLNEADVVLCGGGVKNATLMQMLNSTLFGNLRPLLTTADFGIPIDAKECVSFAVLAAARMDTVPANLPRVTGATRRVVLGDVSLG